MRRLEQFFCYFLSMYTKAWSANFCVDLGVDLTVDLAVDLGAEIGNLTKRRLRHQDR